MLIFISTTLLRQGVCVYHLYRCKTSSRGVWHSCPTTRNEAVGMSGGKLGRFPVPAILYYIYIVPPLGAFKSQLGGTYSILLLFCTVIDSCDYITYIYIYLLICFIVSVLLGFCTHDTFQIKIRKSFLYKCVTHVGSTR